MTENQSPPDDLSVVCFGASAGGFKAYCTILSLLPADTGLAFIIVHHQPELSQISSWSSGKM
jgi:chemotaxis response regulator CheB